MDELHFCRGCGIAFSASSNSLSESWFLYCPNLSLLRFGGDILQEFTCTHEILKEKWTKFLQATKSAFPVGTSCRAHRRHAHLPATPAGSRWALQPQSLPVSWDQWDELSQKLSKLPKSAWARHLWYAGLVPICCLDDVFLLSAIFKALMLQISCQVE